MREHTRLHHDLIDYDRLDAQERFKDSDPMEQMLELIREYDGLTIYRTERFPKQNKYPSDNAL